MPSKNQAPPLPPIGHDTGCACNECIKTLQYWIAETVPIEDQIDFVVRCMQDNGPLQLLPVLRTLQFVRDNQDKIRKALA